MGHLLKHSIFIAELKYSKYQYGKRLISLSFSCIWYPLNCIFPTYSSRPTNAHRLCATLVVFSQLETLVCTMRPLFICRFPTKSLGSSWEKDPGLWPCGTNQDWARSQRPRAAQVKKTHSSSCSPLQSGWIGMMMKKKKCHQYLITVPAAHCVFKGSSGWLLFHIKKPDLGCSDVLSKLVACRHEDLGQKLCKKLFTPDESLKVRDNHSNPLWRASWFTEYPNTWADDVSPKAAFLFKGGMSRQKDTKCSRDSIIFSHHCHCCISAQHHVTAQRELRGGIQFKLHIYWLSYQHFVSIICFR